MSKDFQRMQKLAGLITEVNIEPAFRKPTSFTSDDLELSDPNNTEGFKWKEQPRHPEDMLTIYDSDGETEDTITKQSFWESDIIGRDPWDILPDGASEEGGVWSFSFDDGSSISGFVKGEDFTFGR